MSAGHETEVSCIHLDLILQLSLLTLVVRHCSKNYHFRVEAERVPLSAESKEICGPDLDGGR